MYSTWWFWGGKISVFMVKIYILRAFLVLLAKKRMVLECTILHTILILKQYISQVVVLITYQISRPHLWLDLQKGAYSLSNWINLTMYCGACEHGINLKFGRLTLLTWFFSWEQFYINRLNTLWVVTNWSWKSRKAPRPLFIDPVMFMVMPEPIILCFCMRIIQ